MHHSSIFFVPTPTGNPDATAKTLATLTESLTSHPAAYPQDTPLTLHYRLLRSTPTDPPKPPETLPQHHLLSLSSISPEKTFCHVQKPTSESNNTSPTIIAIPVSSLDSHASFLTGPMGALWTPGHSIKATGETYILGETTIQLAALTQQRGDASHGAQTLSPGVVVCIGMQNEDVDPEDIIGDEASMKRELADGGKAQIRALWDQFFSECAGVNKNEVKEVNIGIEGMSEKTTRNALIKMWCEVLKLRG
ncbi:hypothetical protein M011DRAFT_102610 [Sporormia fimetaria CBS 119925]|uniref:Uncharacterized protein n=1 Tax=Sporormia fimetaria CBS 119925 TaxID=1340428 RepID=A0A6A6VKM1_9PLEO|nr:hypothetical protein M011DRAFT_102610 [Sporormia fimetaria CBS 119925]